MNQLLTLQQKADEYLIADPAVLQLGLLLQLNSCRLTQSILDSADDCGCLTTNGAPTNAPQSPCPACRQKLTERIAAILFYTAAITSALGLNLDDICTYEIDKLDLLGYFLV